LIGVEVRKTTGGAASWSQRAIAEPRRQDRSVSAKGSLLMVEAL